MSLQSLTSDYAQQLVEEIRAELKSIFLQGGNLNSHSQTLNLILNVIQSLDPRKREDLVHDFEAKKLHKIFGDGFLKSEYDAIKNEIENHFKYDAIYCLTINIHNILMWGHYTNGHIGGVVEFTPSNNKNSIFHLSKPVNYSNVRPALYESGKDFVTTLFKSESEVGKEIIERMIHTKGTDWSYENEYRLHLPGELFNRNSYAFLGYHPAELTGVYLGCKMSMQDKEKIAHLARNINPDISIYSAQMSARDFTLNFLPYNSLGH